MIMSQSEISLQYMTNSLGSVDTLSIKETIVSASPLYPYSLTLSSSPRINVLAIRKKSRPTIIIPIIVKNSEAPKSSHPAPKNSTLLSFSKIFGFFVK